MARICHIAGRRPGSARYDDTMTDEDRNGFNNLILMCPSHHVLIDNLEPNRFTVAILQEMKAKALEANGPKMGSQGWATDSQLDRYVTFAAVALERQYAGEDASVTRHVNLTGRADATFATTGVLSVRDEPRDEPDQSERDRYAVQIRQILGYDNVLSRGRPTSGQYSAPHRAGPRGALDGSRRP